MLTWRQQGGWGSGNMLGKTKRREGEKKKGAEREEEGEVEGCYKCSGEIWETVQDFHYLWCKLSDAIIRPLISLSHFLLPFLSIFLWSMKHSAEGCRTPLVGLLAGAPGKAQRLGTSFRGNPSLIRACSISLQETLNTHDAQCEKFGQNQKSVCLNVLH